MESRIFFRAIVSCVALWTLVPLAKGQVTCWAPGMAGSVTLSENNRSGSVSLGKPYRYEVYGVAGRLVLGDKAVNTLISGGKFHQKLLGLIPTGAVVDSTAYVRLQTGLTQLYPEQLSVTNSTPGTAVGPLLKYGTRWTLCDPQNPVNVNLSFHMAGSNLLTALVPGLLSPAYYNLNPSGHFYVLGEYHPSPPVMTGDISVATNSVIYGSAVPLSYRIDRVELPPVFRPPFIGLDLGDINLTVIGSPPTGPMVNNGPVNLPEIQTPDILSVAIDLSGTQGNGWLKIQRTP